MTATEAAGRIPLRDREGNVRAWALVDPEMVSDLSAHRWKLGSKGAAVRQVGPKARRRTVAMHRQVLGLPPTGPPSVRHLNSDPLDNRLANLAVSRRWLAGMLSANHGLAHLLSNVVTGSAGPAHVLQGSDAR